MYVAPEANGRGIGKLLISELLKKVKTLGGVEQINLGVVVSNVRAKGLYASFGFETYGTEKNALKLGEQYFDEELMVIFLC